MGNGSIVFVLGFITLFGIININFNRKNLEGVDNAIGFVRYTTARDIAYSSVRITLRKIDTTSVLPSSFTVSGNFGGGSYLVDATSNGDTLRLYARGRMMDSVYTIRATLFRYPKPFPGSVFTSALGLRPSPVNFLMQGTSARIDGRDHDTSGVMNPDPSLYVPAVTCMTTADSQRVYNGTQRPDSMLRGSQKIAVNPNIDDPGSYMDELIENADFRYQTPPDNDITIGATNWGSPTNPVIVYADARDTNKVKFAGNSTGWGILLVRGSIEVTGTLTWKGLVIAHSDTQIDFKTSGGTSLILGGFLFSGAPGSTFMLKGTGKILHSNRTIEKAKNVNKLLAYAIIDWYE